LDFIAKKIVVAVNSGGEITNLPDIAERRISTRTAAVSPVMFRPREIVGIPARTTNIRQIL
jgi:hypothetical protein